MGADELLQEIRSNIETPYGVVTFTPSLEDHYRTVTLGGRRRAGLAAGWIGVFILQCFTIAVMVTLPADQIWMKLGFFLVIDIFVIGVLIAIFSARNHWFLDSVLVYSLIFVSLLVCASYYYDMTEMAYYGLMCYIFVPVTANSMLRMLFRQALTISTTAMVFFTVTVMSKPGVPLHVQITALLLIYGCSAMTLWANHRNDHDERLAFLFLTREKLIAEERQRQTEVLRELTTLDPLTSIANRRGFEERFEPLVARCRQDGRPIVVMMIDIDHFKAFNDRYGHIRGDACLRNVAQTLAGQLRGPDDLIARMGGEEFVVVAPGLAEGEALGFLERLHGADRKSVV
jgi:GGDEF domain-containing protein